MNSTLTYSMDIMLLVNHSNLTFWPTPPYDYALIASVSLVFGILVMFFWRRAELNRLKAEVDRLTELCHDWENIVNKQNDELEKERNVREGLEEEFRQQKDYTEEVLERTNFLYVAMLKNGTLKRDDLKWLASQQIANIMRLFEK